MLHDSLGLLSFLKSLNTTSSAVCPISKISLAARHFAFMFSFAKKNNSGYFL